MFFYRESLPCVKIKNMSKLENKKLCEAVGKRMRELRTELAISQNDLAALADLHNSIIGKIERGLTNPKLDTLTRIAKALDTNVSDLTAHVTNDLLSPKTRERISAKDLIEERRRATAGGQ